MSDSDSQGMVLASFMAQAGVASRRACEKLVRAREVEVNGVVTDIPATRVTPGVDRVCWQGKELRISPKRYYLLHKPVGYLCSAKDPHHATLAISLLDLAADERVYSIGRLDKNSEGLLLFTNDGDLAQRLLHPSHGVAKEYEVEVSGRPQQARLRELLAGIVDRGENLRARSVQVVEARADGGTVRIAVGEGKNHEIRRMCEYLGHKVRRLRRIRFGPLELGKFTPGFSRRLTEAEVAALRSACGSSD